MNTEKIGAVLSYIKGGEEKDENIFWNGEQLTIGTIRNLGLREYCSDNNTTKMYARVAFITQGNNAEVDVPIVDLEKGEFLKNRPPFFHLLTTIDKKTEKFFCKSLLRSISGLSAEKYYRLHFGYNNINGKVVYNTGDRLINGSEINNCISTSDNIMKYVESKPIDVYKKWISELLKSFNYPPVLLIAALVPYIFPLIDKSKRVHYEFGVYIVGKSGCGKTEIAKLLVTPFTDNCNMISLSSDSDAIHEMSVFTNCSVLFDDLNASDSDVIRRKKETKVASIIETLQSVGKSVIDGKNSKIRALPFITAEYTLKREGLINRCLIVNIDESFRPKSLTWLQENHDAYISFINSFIEFICKNYQMLHDYINNCLSSEKYHMKKGNGISSWVRISNIKFVLEITLDVMKAFLGVYCDETTCFLSYVDTFKQSINECIDYTLDLIKERKKDKDEVIITKLLDDIWNPESEIVTTDKEHFLCGIKNNPDSLPERFVLYQQKKQRFCLRSKDAERYLCHRITYSTITNKLDNLGLIRAGKDRTKAIFKGETNAKFLCINEESLVNYLGVDDDYLPPNMQDETDIHYNRQRIIDSEKTDYGITQPELNEEVYKDLESQMCVLSDDDTPEDERVLKHYIEEATKRSKKHR